MYRHTFAPLLLIIACLLLGTPSSHAQQLKIGTLDMNRVFNEYYKTKDAQAQLGVVRDASKKEMDERVANLKQAMAAIDKLSQEIDRPELSKATKLAKTKERDDKVNEARMLDRDITEFRSMKERQLQDQFGRMRADIIKDIMSAVTDRVKSAGYDFVFDKSGLSLGQVPVVLYSRDDMDFSADIINILNKNAPKLKTSSN